MRLPVLLTIAGVLGASTQTTVDLRGRKQDVYRYSAPHPAEVAILFLPGDGGWRGFAIQMAQSLARNGFDVYGWDVRQYLAGFTSGKTTLTEREIQSDTSEILKPLNSYRRVVLVGWSQGAAMAILAAADPQVRKQVAGVVALGVPEAGLLGWRFADNLTLITKKEPDEPTFQTAPSIARIAPLPFGMIQSSADEYTSREATQKLFAVAGDPKRLDMITAQNHRYDGNRDELLRVLTDQVNWVLKQ